MERTHSAWSRIGKDDGSLLVGGEWRAALSGNRFAVSDPARGEIIAEVADAEQADVQAAVKAAESALTEWSNMPSWERYRILHDAARRLEAQSEDLAVVLTGESGKPLVESRAEIRNTIRFIDWFSHETLRLPGQHWASVLADREIIVHAEPVGVVAAITPWNFPGFLVACKIGAALAAGCTVVLKPAEQTPLTALAMARAFDDAGLPAGVLNVLPCARGEVVGDALVRAPEVTCVSFTGSRDVGKKLLHRGAESIKRVLLELGGNSPALVLGDADLDLAVPHLVRARFGNAGQTCVAVNRVYVVESVAEAFLERVCATVGELRLEDPLLESCSIGPMIEMAAVERIEKQTASALAEGARLLTGGKRVRETGTSAYLEPAVLVAQSDRQPTVFREELFGPVMAVVVCKDEEETMRLANDSEYGLAGYVFTANVARGHALAKRLNAGTVGVNRALVSEPQLPFGGMRGSGLGRERGRAGVEEFLETKTVHLGN